MGTILSLLNRVKAFDATSVDRLSSEAIDKTKVTLIALNREQMLEGKTNKGTNMRSYLDDPYFKSRESAQRYSDWKDSITPNAKRQKGVMNLYIIGTFHQSISINVKGSVIHFEASFLGTEIERKNPDIFSLNAEKRVVYNDTLRPALLSLFRKELRL